MMLKRFTNKDDYSMDITTSIEKTVFVKQGNNCRDQCPEWRQGRRASQIL